MYKIDLNQFHMLLLFCYPVFFVPYNILNIVLLILLTLSLFCRLFGIIFAIIVPLTLGRTHFKGMFIAFHILS